MNIVYISALEGGKYSGPLHSVPNQIIAQSKYDNVFWVNLTDINTSSEVDNKIYHYIPTNSFSLEKLPNPFDRPDLIVFEEFFKIECCIVARKIEKRGIPYVIVPRCQMTQKYLQNKRIKKMVASVLLFSHFARHSQGVQFLSNQEKEDSKGYYKGTYSVIANGIDLPIKSFEATKNGTIICTFIGRYSIWQKGLDLLIGAISNMVDDLKKSGIVFHLYGPDERTGSKAEIERLVNFKKVSDIVKVFGPVFDTEKEQILRNSSLFVHTSRFEGMPMSVLEALAYGLPCIVTQGSNLREEIEDMDAGWGCETTEEDIVVMLRRVIKEKDAIKKKSENAIKLASTYSWQRISSQTHKWYLKLIN